MSCEIPHDTTCDCESSEQSIETSDIATSSDVGAGGFEIGRFGDFPSVLTIVGAGVNSLTGIVDDVSFFEGSKYLLPFLLTYQIN